MNMIGWGTGSVPYTQVLFHENLKRMYDLRACRRPVTALWEGGNLRSRCSRCEGHQVDHLTGLSEGVWRHDKFDQRLGVVESLPL